MCTRLLVPLDGTPESEPNRDTARATENAAYALVPTVTIGRPHGQVHDDDRYAADDDR